MADGIYVSMCGAVARTEQLDAIADNLANASTPGFKAARPAFEAFLPPGAGPASDKQYPAAVAAGFDLRPGPTQRTDNPLDVVPGDGLFLTVKTAAGTPAYTRDGRMTVDADRRLLLDGHPVLSPDGQPITLPPTGVPRVNGDGTVWVDDQQAGELGLARLQGPLDRVGPALLAPAPGGRAVPAGDERSVRVGEVELGNAPAVESVVQLISAQRSYDASMQAIQTYSQMNQRAVEVVRLK
jgi:flagellar basal-body rod protein FlgF